MTSTDSGWDPPPAPAEPQWGPAPTGAWASDNPEATLIILELCEVRRFFSSVVDAEGRDIFQERKGLAVPEGSVVVVLPEDGRTYLVAPDGADCEQLRFLGQYQGDLT